MMRFLPQRALHAPAASPSSSAASFRTRAFISTSIHLLKRRLSKRLFESRHSAGLRQRIINHFDEVADRYDCTARSAWALRS